MEEYLKKGIKDIITKFPKVADILNEYNIGCVPCNVGSCLLKDIVEIHNLGEDEEAALMAKIGNVIYPGRGIKIPKVQRKAKSKQIQYSPPIKKLVDEHVLIKAWLALIPEVIENIDLKSRAGRQLILGGIDFIRSYADKFHHAKEEDILFKYFDPNLDIVKTMLEDHTTARSRARALLDALEKGDERGVVEHLSGYKELLSEHIKKEDEILYPWLDRNLSMTQVGELYEKFDKADRAIGEEVPKRCEKFVEWAEGKITKKKNSRKEAVK
ncbi:MAG: hypothetical protein A2987_00735 [Omnitrophica bacterium RIFCSPLOWO2_01_FULL_45_10]|nr:MAG: hypothetical protein A2987_00735 [Omnitrophica bacterium RIFCSPLOWO2_01_FULL_45_10]